MSFLPLGVGMIHGSRGRGLATASLVLLLCLGLAACSENFGMAPGTTGTVAVGVASQGFAGPVPPTRTALAFAGNGSVFAVGMERGGSYIVRPGAAPAWSPGPGKLGNISVQSISVDPSGRLWLVQPVAPFLGHFSTDGGRSFEPVLDASDPTLPPGVIPPLDGAMILGESEVHPAGALFVVKDQQAHVRSLAGSTWQVSQLPGPITIWGPLARDVSPAGVLVAVDVGPRWEVWRSDDGGDQFSVEQVVSPGPVLALSSDGAGDVVLATPTQLGRGGAPENGPGAGALWTHVGFTVGAMGDAYFLGITDAGRAVSARVGAVAASVTLPAALAEADPVATTTGGFVAGRGGELWQLTDGSWSSAAFEGGALNLSAVDPDPREARAVLFGSSAGRVWRQGSDGAAETLGIPLSNSTLNSLLADPGSATGVFAGSFGVRYQSAPGAAWLERNEGQRSLVFGFEEVNVSRLSFDAGSGALWLGSTNGDGPYVSFNSGAFWTVRDQGLGEGGLGGSGESGYEGLRDVTGFAFAAESTWMSAFRGGVFRLNETTATWEQRNAGLITVEGAAVDTCCFEPRELFVDVRDLDSLADGTLLAATGFGVFRLEPGEQRWQPSSFGLAARDCRSIAPHPTRPGWVVAAMNSTASQPVWLYLSQDGGNSWRPAETWPTNRNALRVIWSDPDALEVMALLAGDDTVIGSGVWRVQLSP